MWKCSLWRLYSSVGAGIFINDTALSTVLKSPELVGIFVRSTSSEQYTCRYLGKNISSPLLLYTIGFDEPPTIPSAPYPKSRQSHPGILVPFGKKEAMAKDSQ